MNKIPDAEAVLSRSEVVVTLGWDDVFGPLLHVRGGMSEAERVVMDLERWKIGSKLQGDGARRLKREGCELVILFSERVESLDDFKSVRRRLCDAGYVVEPPEGVETVPSPYGERLRPLFTRGSYFEKPEAPSAAELGLTVETDGADLLRIALDPEFDASSHPEAVWAPVWAWLLIGELRPAGALPVFARLFDRLNGEEGDDAVMDALPKALGRFGLEAAQLILDVVRDEARPSSARWTAVSGLQEIAAAWPEERDGVVLILAGLLRDRAVMDREVNGGIVDELINLEAVEAAPAIEEAFAGGRVDETITGDWDEVQVALGLKEASEFNPKEFGLGGVPVRRETPKVGRNDPCPCGSGKKFKKRCGA